MRETRALWWLSIMKKLCKQIMMNNQARCCLGCDICFTLKANYGYVKCHESGGRNEYIRAIAANWAMKDVDSNNC